MLGKVKHLIEQLNIDRILVQTDDKSILDYFSNHLDNIITIDELPVINGEQGFHYHNRANNVINPVEYSQILISTCRLLSEVKAAVIPSSNLAGWVYLERGNAKNVYQFNKHGKAGNEHVHASI